MTTDNSDPFKERRHGDIVFRDFHDRLFFIGKLSPSQQKEWLRDHPDRHQTLADALRDLQARAGTDVEAEPAEPRSTKSANEVRTSGESDGPLPVAGEDKRQPDKPATDTAPLTITNPEATAAAGDEIIIDGRRFISERRLAEVLGRHPRTLQRWRQQGKGPPSTRIGRSFFYEINEVQEWMDRKKAGDVGGRILADDPAFGINPPMPRR
jgi:predicted DNA-binding transcriptional regulator AlpA